MIFFKICTLISRLATLHRSYSHSITTRISLSIHSRDSLLFLWFLHDLHPRNFRPSHTQQVIFKWIAGWKQLGLQFYQNHSPRWIERPYFLRYWLERNFSLGSPSRHAGWCTRIFLLVVFRDTQGTRWVCSFPTGKYLSQTVLPTERTENAPTSLRLLSNKDCRRPLRSRLSFEQDSTPKRPKTGRGIFVLDCNRVREQPRPGTEGSSPIPIAIRAPLPPHAGGFIRRERNEICFQGVGPLLGQRKN